MTYGVDQCRMCGKTIRPPDGRSMQRYLESKSKKPTMAEPDWRAAGFKDAPTKYQMLHPRDGTCYQCQFVIGMRIVPLWKLFFSVLAFAVVAILIFFFLGRAYT